MTVTTASGVFLCVVFKYVQTCGTPFLAKLAFASVSFLRIRPSSSEAFYIPLRLPREGRHLVLCAFIEKYQNPGRTTNTHLKAGYATEQWREEA